MFIFVISILSFFWCCCPFDGLLRFEFDLVARTGERHKRCRDQFWHENPFLVHHGLCEKAILQTSVKPLSGTLKGRSGIKKNGDKGQSVKICVPQYPGRNVFPFKNSERFERTRNERERERMVIQRPLVQRYITDLSCKFQNWNTHQRNCRLRVSPFFSNFESSWSRWIS